MITIYFLMAGSSCFRDEMLAASGTPTPIAWVYLPLISKMEPENGSSEHRIGIRLVDGVGEFYDRVSGEKSVPRGNNYIRLAWQQHLWGEATFYHSTFNIDFYDPSRAAQALQRMRENGYNVVRVFLNHCCAGGIGGGSEELSTGYLDNVVDFLKKARANGIYVMFTLDWLPGGKYGALIDAACCETFDGANVHFLSAEGLQANQLFFQDFLKELIAHDAPLDAIFAYELRNELAFDSNEPPLSLSSGLVTTANGETYDMAVPEDKKRMMDEGLVYWVDQVRAAILKVDSTALVGVGFFHPQEPNPTRIGDPRIIDTYPAIWESSADFIDLHLYPGTELTLTQYVENFKLNDMSRKPLVMGEFGAFRWAYPSLETAAAALQAWQIESCQYGFDGWLLWTWDTDETSTGETPEIFSGLSGGGDINHALAPVNRPDPCAPGAGVKKKSPWANEPLLRTFCRMNARRWQSMAWR